MFNRIRWKIGQNKAYKALYKNTIYKAYEKLLKSQRINLIDKFNLWLDDWVPTPPGIFKINTKYLLTRTVVYGEMSKTK